MLIEGENDKFVPLEDALDMIKVKFLKFSTNFLRQKYLTLKNLQILKNGYLAVLSNGSHMCIMEQHETINSLILLFLNDSFQ